ncbi:MAG TPA: GNAT family N-acetyltransferase [Streptosporangiaceae bacterium]|nr:GNAT family N-acetyltransferase [Streptosporangiaceae bacterium]
MVTTTVCPRYRRLPIVIIVSELVYELSTIRASNAARTVVEHALCSLGLPEVLAEVDEGNTASVAVVERLGMTPFEVVPGVLGPMTRFRRVGLTP